MVLTGDVVVTCSSASTSAITTVTTTLSGSIPSLPPLLHQQSVSTPCLTQHALYQPINTFQQPLLLNQGLTLGDPQQHNSNPTLPSSTGETNSWQIIRSSKRKKNGADASNLKLKLKRYEPYNPRPIITPSQYTPIAIDDDDIEIEDNPTAPANTNNTNNQGASNTQPATFQPSQPKPSPPPPVFIQGVINYQEMRNSISAAIPDTDYITRTLANNTVKINPKTVDTYRALVRHLRAKNVAFHTYQLKQERAYRVVLRHIHHSIPTSAIKTELETLNFRVRNVMNITSRSKNPLNLFFVDLEPSENNKQIFDLQYLLNMKIAVEPPRKSSNIAQCTRCQIYGHTKTYCTRPFSCVKCGKDHITSSCVKPRDTPATCALCDGPHPANYKGCTVYKDIQNMRRKQQNGPRNQSFANQISAAAHLNNTNATTTTTTNNNTSTQSRSYASVLLRNQTAQNPQQSTPNDQPSLTTFLQEFKTMFHQLMSQNTMIIQMLQSVITSIIQK